MPLQQRFEGAIDISLPEGTHELTLSLVCDSYIGADTEHTFTVQVAEGEESSEEEEDDEDDEDNNDDTEMGS